MSSDFGEFVRSRREALNARDGTYSLRSVATKSGLEPSYLSKIERGLQPPPSEESIVSLAEGLQVNADVLLALAGKVSKDVRSAILRRPELFAELIRSLNDLPDNAVIRIVREVRDGNW